MTVDRSASYAYLAVDDPAVAPDLPGVAGPDVAHLYHGRREVAVEERGAGAVLPHQRVLRPAVEELLVGVEQAPPRQQVGEVGRVERHRGLRVDGRQVAVAAGPRARLLPERREGGVDVGVAAVDAGAEGGAPGLPDGVCARQRRHVARREALPAEQGDERAEAGRRRRQVLVGEGRACRRRVAPAQRHVPARSAELRTTTTRKKVSEFRCVTLSLTLTESQLRTRLVPSRAASARMSAHDTTPGHAASTFLLMVSMTSNPRTEFAFGPAVFSPPASRRIEPSHPCQHHTHWSMNKFMACS
jgi:hypothetical protein